MLFMCFSMLKAQNPQQPVSFFDEKGGIRPESIELKKDSVVSIFHRADDIVWSRVVYRIVDMRYKQNYQLYFPLKVSDPEYRSLFKLLLDAIVEGLPVYRKTNDDIKPFFEKKLTNNEIATTLMSGDPLDDNMDWDLATSGDFLLNHDSVTDALTFNAYSYEDYVRNQIKFVVQEVIFFDKHTSRLHSKVLALAPLYSGNVSASEGNIMAFLQKSLLFWVSYDEFRPYLSTQLIIPNKNDRSMLTFDNFFIQKLYFSYILGDSNLFGRMLLDAGNSVATEKRIRKEQERIETELLNFEQDLWEY